MSELGLFLIGLGLGGIVASYLVERSVYDDGYQKGYRGAILGHGSETTERREDDDRDVARMG